MANYATYKDSITALVSNLKTLFGNTTMNEAQAIAASATKPNTIFYTSDTHNIVLNGQIYGRSEQITADAFAYLPANEAAPGQDPAFSDTTKIYIQPTSTAGVMKLWWYYNGTWVSTDTMAMSVPASAEDITYDLTNTPDLGEGDVQSAIEAVDAKVDDVDQRIDDEKVEFIKERFPLGDVNELYTQRNKTTVTFNNVTNGSGVWILDYQASTNYVARWTEKKVPKGALVVVNVTMTSSAWMICGWDSASPQEYYTEHSNSIVDYVIHNRITATNALSHTYSYIMPDDGYLIWQLRTNITTVTINVYDPTLLTDLYTEYYQKGVADGSAMASIVGLGYDITDYLSFTKLAPVDKTGFAYGVEIKEGAIATPIAGTKSFYADSKIVYFPKVDLSGLTRVSAGGANSDAATAKAFISNNANLVTLPPNLSFPNIESSAQRLFSNCAKLKRIGTLGSVKLSYGQYFVYNNAELEVVGDISANTEIMYTWMSAFRACAKLHRIEGLSYKGMSWWYQTSATTLFTSTTALRYLLIKDIGYKNLSQTSQVNTLNFSGLSVWGAANDADPDALQSLVDSLLTYSYDRVTDADNVGTIGVDYIIKLHANTLARLTEEQKTAITAKGFTLTT